MDIIVRRLLLFFLICCSIIMLRSTGFADIYSWVDENGVRHFSNNRVDPDGEKADISAEYQQRVQKQKPSPEGERDPGTKRIRAIVDDRAYNESMRREEEINNRQRQDLQRRMKAEEAAIQNRKDEFAKKCETAKDKLFQHEFKGLKNYWGNCWSLAESNRMGDPHFQERRNRAISNCRKKGYEQTRKKYKRDIDTYCKEPYTPEQERALRKNIELRYGKLSSGSGKKKEKPIDLYNDCKKYTKKLKDWKRRKPDKKKQWEAYLKNLESTQTFKLDEKVMWKSKPNPNRHKSRAWKQADFDRKFSARVEHWQKELDFLEKAKRCKCRNTGCEGLDPFGSDQNPR